MSVTVRLTVLRHADDELGDRSAPRDLAGDFNFPATQKAKSLNCGRSVALYNANGFGPTVSSGKN